MKQADYRDSKLTPEERAELLLRELTLDEKIGQTNLIWGLKEMTQFGFPDPVALVRAGAAGSILYAKDRAERNEYQRLALEESRVGIPLIFASDITHGYDTGFPAPLAMAATWNDELLEKAQRAVAKEARQDGLHWTYFPNADIARDARWGRVQETMGEDPYLSSRLVAAQVKGFQGESLDCEESIAACLKHFAGYGACVGGRDYDSVFLPESEFRNIYLKPFKAGVDAGVASIMTAYMDVNNVPATVNRFLMKQVLRQEWGYDGAVVSDAGTVGSLVMQGHAKDMADAALRAMGAQLDIDMASCTYLSCLKGLVESGKLSEKDIDRAAKAVLTLKFKLGLFEHPYAKEHSEDKDYSAEHRALAREVAAKSIVLLKNEGVVLPLSDKIKKLAVIGPMADAPDDMEGVVGVFTQPKSVTVLQGIRARAEHTEVMYAPGPWIKCDVPKLVNQFMPYYCGKEQKAMQTPAEADKALLDALAVAGEADAVVIVLGETVEMSGESGSASDIGLKGRQEELLKEVMKLGKPVVLVLIGGRPLAVSWAKENVPAIVEAWQLGHEGGNAVADVLFGDVNPSGKLPITFPRSAGQCPKYYAENRTHMPADEQPQPYSRYWNELTSPLFPFGYGLSYTEFGYENLKVLTPKAKPGEEIRVSADIINRGGREGEETVQLYIHQRYGTDTRPKRELKGFRKLSLKPGEKKTVEFCLTADELSYWSSSAESWIADEAEFDVWIGADSTATLHGEFSVHS